MTLHDRHGREALTKYAAAIDPPTALTHRMLDKVLCLLAHREQAECRLQIGDGKAITRMPVLPPQSRRF